MACKETEILELKEQICESVNHDCTACPLNKQRYFNTTNYEWFDNYRKRHKLNVIYEGVTICEIASDAKFYRRRDHKLVLSQLKHIIKWGR